MKYYKSEEEAKKAYDEYINGHVQNVKDAFELLLSLDIPYIKENEDAIREIVSVHDDSKWSDREYFPYLHHFYPTSEEEANMEEEFDNAVQLHCLNNRHHWNCQDWIDTETGSLKGGFDDTLYMNHTVERICDWLAMAYQHNEPPSKWWDANKEGIKMPDYAVDFVEEVIHKVPEDFKLSFQKTRGELDEAFDQEKADQLQRAKEYLANNPDDPDIQEVIDKIKELEGEGSNTVPMSNRIQNYLEESRKLLKKVFGDEFYENNDTQVTIGIANLGPRTAGRCITRKNPYKQTVTSTRIEINKYVEDYSNDMLYALVIHEYVHSLKCCIFGGDYDGGHNSTWKRIANALSSEIGMSASSFMNIEEINNMTTNYQKNRKSYYIIKCKHCGEEQYKYSGSATIVQHPEYYKHRCADGSRGDFEVKRITNEESIITPGGKEDKEYNKETLIKLVQEATKYVPDIMYELQQVGYQPDDKSREGKKFIIDVINNNYGKGNKREDKNIEIAICNALHKDGEEYLKEEDLYNIVPGGKGYLAEASMSKLKRDTLTQDPTRAKKSKHVQSKYIGISKYGVLNFETTSETYSGVKWYQEVHFPSLSGFMNIIEQGDEIEAVDIQKAMKSDNIKVSCDDPSFLYWAWKYKAWRDVYGLEKETRAPKRNNTQLQGALCKHLYSVIELLGQKRIIDLITRDMNEFCKRKLNKSNKGYQDSPEMLNKDLKADQYDYNIEDVYKALLSQENFNKWMEGTPLEDLGLTPEEISDIDKAIKSMRSSSQYALRSELEKQFEPVKRGRRITRPDIKLQVGSNEEEEEG